MILDAKGSVILSHFIRPEYLVDVLKSGTITLIRQDKQPKDPNDGKLPQACFDQPYEGRLEQMLGANPAFLANHAEAINGSRDQRFIHCWTFGPTPSIREAYSEGGRRCELRSSEEELKRILGYEFPQGDEFPPPHQKIPEIPGAHGTVQLVPVVYTDGKEAIPVVPSYGATTHKHSSLKDEAEIRVEALVYPDGLVVGSHDSKLRWSLRGFDGLHIVIGTKVPAELAAEICRLAAERNIPVSGV